ncbi:hypothetical protein CAAN3_01S08306 [[Candida] anglica]
MTYGKVRHIRLIHLRNILLPCVECLDETNLKQDHPSRERKESISRRFGQILGNGVQKHTRQSVDTFYSLHIGPGDQLIYISEVVNNDLSPNFQQISFPELSMEYSNGKLIKVKVWCKPSDSIEDWILLQEINIDLLKLIPIDNETITEEELENNSIIMIFDNGATYTMKEYIRGKYVKYHGIVPLERKPSYAFDSIRSINSLNRSNKELIGSKRKLSNQISELLKQQSSCDNKQFNEDNKIKLENFIKKQLMINDTISSKIMKLKVSMREIQELIDKKLNNNIEIKNDEIEYLDTTLDPMRETLTNSIYPEILLQLKQITKVIEKMIILENIPNTVRFRIMGVEFPSNIKELLEICYYNIHPLNGLMEGEDHLLKINMINAGISYISQIITIFADVCDINLKYRIRLNGSYCTIFDPTIRNEQEKMMEFPLYYNMEDTIKKLGSPPENVCINKNYIYENSKFEYGLSLLNKNLMNIINIITEMHQRYSQSERINNLQQRIPIDCMDNLLWNIQFLTLFLTC